MWKPALGREAASKAAQRTFHTYADLLPAEDSTICVRAVSGDNRKPCTAKMLKDFIATLDLGSLGIGQGDRLCASIPNGPEAALAFLSMSMYCTYAPLNPALTAAEVEFEFEDLPAKAVIVQNDMQSYILNEKKLLQTLRNGGVLF